MYEYTFDGQFYESKSRVGGIAGKKPIDSVFSKSTSGLEIIDPFCDPRDSDKNPISYSPSAVLIEFQRSRSLSKRILWSVLLPLSPEIKSTGNRDRSRGLKMMIWRFIRQRRASWLPIPRWNESFHLATAKVEFGTGQRGKQRGIPKWKGKGQFQTKDPVSRGKLPGVQVSSPEGLCPPKAAFFIFSLSLQWTERWEAGLGLLKSLVSPTARVKGESQDYVQPGVRCQRSPSRRKGE